MTSNEEPHHRLLRILVLRYQAGDPTEPADPFKEEMAATWKSTLCALKQQDLCFLSRKPFNRYELIHVNTVYWDSLEFSSPLVFKCP